MTGRSGTMENFGIILIKCLFISIALFHTHGLKKNGHPFIINSVSNPFPLVVNTWDFTNATLKAWQALSEDKRTALDAVEVGCMQCELEQCDFTVGYGGSPDENGETTLDAMIMDGKSMDIGAVGALRRIKHAISVARYVMEYTEHTFLVGDQASAFAKAMNFPEEPLYTPDSHAKWREWIHFNCQPNFWKNVSPNPKQSCGPYTPNQNSLRKSTKRGSSSFNEMNHDTIGMIAIDTEGNIAAGTSTNGANHKIPGRVGDSPIPGSGAYADNEVGAAAATGDGDVMMRFLPSFLAVEEMRKGFQPDIAGQYAMRRIAKFYPKFMGGIVVVNKDGQYGAACHGLSKFHYSVGSEDLGGVKVLTTPCINEYL
ncbi:hypothetical protein J437_LFUL001327 [Ladona fulva]|uniref:N(4)-(beta-N-acetylglucosaminyl)-L-asparaginase n=1 Tax=Ladona fulva TaxID=123851 RepID=A0A8K0JTW4_LADFU|nr:hypothetical protein J437_LFUL001327 [Ladona fulva]